MAEFARNDDAAIQASPCLPMCRCSASQFRTDFWLALVLKISYPLPPYHSLYQLLFVCSTHLSIIRQKLIDYGIMPFSSWYFNSHKKPVLYRMFYIEPLKSSIVYIEPSHCSDNSVTSKMGGGERLRCLDKNTAKRPLITKPPILAPPGLCIVFVYTHEQTQTSRYASDATSKCWQWLLRWSSCSCGFVCASAFNPSAALIRLPALAHFCLWRSLCRLGFRPEQSICAANLPSLPDCLDQINAKYFTWVPFYAASLIE